MKTYLCFANRSDRTIEIPVGVALFLSKFLKSPRYIMVLARSGNSREWIDLS